MAPFNPVCPPPDAVADAEPDEEVTVADDDKGEDDDEPDSGGSAKRSSIDTTNRSKPLPDFVTNDVPNAAALSRARPKVNNTNKTARFILIK